MKPYVLSRNDAFSVSSPLPGGEEDEWGESGEKKEKEEEITEDSKNIEEDNETVKHSDSRKEEESKKSCEESATPPEDLRKHEETKVSSKKDAKEEEKIESKIRVVASLATDPALRASEYGKASDPTRISSPLATSASPVTSPTMPTPLPSPLPPPKAPADAKEAIDYVSALPPALQTAIAAGRFLCLPPVDASRSKAPELPDNRPGLGYLCTPCGIRFSSASTLEAHQTYYCSHRQTRSDNARNSGGDSEGEEVTAVAVDTKPDDIKSVNSDQGDPAAKSLRTGKQYKCPHCSYSADKKVSLNRHMRMHSSSPVDECTLSSAPLVDRYCQDCDIRFSSLKTFRAHKTHYCGTRHGSSSVPPKQQTRSPSPPQPAPPKPFLVLPTSPVLIVPYALVQSASLISGPAAANITTTDTASVLLPDGSLQPLPLAIASQPTSSDKSAPSVTFSSPENKTSKSTIENPRKIDGREVSSPLDLSYRRSMERDMVIDLEDKENRRSIQNRSRSPLSPEHEDIICAPSIPLILSTSSTCSSPSPSPLSPALSSSSHSSKKIDGRKMRNDSVCNSPSPKSSVVSPSSKSPRSTPNGVVPKPTRIEEKKKADSPLKPDPSISLQNLLLAAVAQSQMDISKGEYPRLPIPPELVPHLLGRLPEGKPGLGLPLRPGDPGLLPYLAPELALNLPPPPPPPPHVHIKQGESKCNECNIVFYRIENYVAHKMYYCGANAAAKMPEDKPSSPPLTTSPKELPKDPTPSTSKLPVFQFICAACGIKFTSYDNLTAHQTYYCPKRTNLEQDKLRRCPKCKVLAGVDHQCAGGSTSLGVGWKCPCCPVTSATASQAQKHMETHSGVKAFLCSICRYKGNTLRGMRTHIRMHFDKKPSDINEESYISCIIEEPGPTKMEIDEKREDSPIREPINGGEPIKVKEEEPDPISQSQINQLPVKPEESEEHIDVDSVKPELIDEPPDQIPDDLSINNNRKISPRYCKSCDISFNYLSTFIAHKRFYCPSHVFENSDNNNSSRHTGTPVS